MSISSENQSSLLHFHRRKTDVLNSSEGAVAFVHQRTEENPDQKTDKDNAKQKPEDTKPDEEKDKPGSEDDEQPKNKDKEGSDEKDKKLMSPQKKRWLIIIAIIVGLAVVAGGVCYWLYARQFETTDDAFIDGHVSQISPQASGRILTLSIVDNQKVEAGQLLAEIDPRDYEVRLAQAEAQYSQSVAQFDLQHANLGQAEANVGVAEADFFQASQDLKRYQSVDIKAITRQQLDNAIAAQKSAQAKLDASNEAVNAAKAQEEAATANVQQSQVAINNAKLQLSYTKITAPIDGRITRRTVEVGNVVTEGQPLLAVVSNELWVTANYKETQLDLMKVGQHVRIKVDAYPDVVFSGHVDSFQKGSGSVFSTLPAENATGNYVKVVQRVPVKIVFDDQDQRDKFPLAPGLSVSPKVTVR